MNRFTSFTKSLVVAGVAFGALATASMAQARTDVVVTVAQPARIAVGEPYGHRQVPTPPIYNHDRGGPFGDADRDGIPNRYDRDSRFYDQRGAYRHAMWGDWDHDGVPNRFDRAPNNPRRH